MNELAEKLDVKFRIVGDGYEIVDIGGHLYVQGAKDITVANAKNITAINSTNINATGVTTINVNDNCNFNVNGEFNLKAAKINMESEGDICLKTQSDLVLYAERTANIKSVGPLAADGSIIDLNGNNSKLPDGVAPHIERIELREYEDGIHSGDCNCRDH